MDTVAVVLAVLAALLALGALGIALSVRRTGQQQRARGDVSQLPEDTRALRQEVAALQADQARALRHLAVIRYDAFPDTGGQLSWSMALLDDAGSGVVLSSIQGRNESRTYAKNVSDWTSEAQLSPEEQDAIEHARP